MYVISTSAVRAEHALIFIHLGVQETAAVPTSFPIPVHQVLQRVIPKVLPLYRPIQPGSPVLRGVVSTSTIYHRVSSPHWADYWGNPVFRVDAHLLIVAEGGAGFFRREMCCDAHY